ncbi:putative S-adenosylmethionine-dependent methyltransferase [Camellia lanceoleosa]|uniref:S-adenosylmethionine-dependent methyltransferase n=1 Tax=Camellia lanceoleosa TaxID=1840588 RepID=A0ACC0G4H1_9ERIC|nr:putative S-adenosylmethionine-dependent methyltransferase [Camellia lanceoleosa]
MPPMTSTPFSLPSLQKYSISPLECQVHSMVVYSPNPLSILHIYSAFALQWLSRVPEKILDKDSSAWNKGNIFYTTASDEVANAYAAQFAEDMGKFLNYRATEVLSGGLMLLLIPTAPDEFHRFDMFGGWIYDALGSSLMDMAKEGLINESQVDSFNMPLYIVRPKEMVKLVEMNACFSIEKIEMTTPLLRIDEPINMDTCTTHIRAGNEKLIAEYFGNEIMDELFDRFYQKVAKLSMVDSKYKENTIVHCSETQNDVNLERNQHPHLVYSSLLWIICLLCILSTFNKIWIN